jgi:hypothetical protein
MSVFSVNFEVSDAVIQQLHGKGIADLSEHGAAAAPQHHITM